MILPENGYNRPNVYRIVQQSCLDPHVIPRHWLERATTTVHQPVLEERLRQKQEELRPHSSSPGKAPPVSYAFGLVKEDALIDAVLETGALNSINQEFLALGNADEGVNLFLHPDLLTEWARKEGYKNPSLIIYKVNK